VLVAGMEGCEIRAGKPIARQEGASGSWELGAVDTLKRRNQLCCLCARKQENSQGVQEVEEIKKWEGRKEKR
jgi:hypothetical protein